MATTARTARAPASANRIGRPFRRDIALGRSCSIEDRLPTAIRRRLDPAQRYGLRLTLFAVGLTLVGIPFGFLLDQVVRNGPLVRVDTWAANTLHEVVRRSDAL